MPHVDPKRYGGILWGPVRARPSPSLVAPGVLYVATDEERIYLNSGEEWLRVAETTRAIEWDELLNKPSTFPPAVHDLGGPAHSGTLHMRRIVGHGAFDNPAHQAAFAASVLRRPR